MRWPKTTRRSPIGLDLGTRNVKAVQLSRGPRGARVEAVTCFPRDTPGAAPTPAESRRILHVLRRRGFVGADVVMACPADKLLSMTMEFPARANAAVLDAAARNEFVRSQKVDAKAMQMTYWSLPTPARAAKTVNVTAVACPHAEADALVDTIEAGGLQVVGLDVRSHALTRACLPAAETGAKGVAIILDLGWSAASLQAVYQGVLVYERAMPEAGLRHLETNLNQSLSLDGDATRHFLFEVGLADSADEVAADVIPALRAHVDQIARDVTASMAYTAQQYPDAPVARVLLVGGGASIPGLARHLERALGAECRPVTPLGCAAAGDTLAAECNPLLTAATGLALFDDL